MNSTHVRGTAAMGSPLSAWTPAIFQTCCGTGEERKTKLISSHGRGENVESGSRGAASWLGVMGGGMRTGKDHSGPEGQHEGLGRWTESSFMGIWEATD